MSYKKKSYSEMVLDSYNRSYEQDLRVEEIEDIRCMVMNIEKRTIYNIIMSRHNIESCDCPHHVYRNILCKHMVVAARYFGKDIYA